MNLLLTSSGSALLVGGLASLGSSGASIQISKTTQAVITAPAPVWLEATNPTGFAVSAAAFPNYDPSFHRITYIWTVRGQPLSAFSSPANMVTGWNNPNVMYGKRVAFSFPDPGTYTIDLWCVDENGTTATAETTVIVVDKFDHYTGNRVIIFDPDADYTNLPSGLQGTPRTTNTWSGLQTLLNNDGIAPAIPALILFRRGKEYPNMRLDIVTREFGHMSAFGTGNRPVLSAPRNQAGILILSDRADMDQITFDGLHFKDDWDPTTETGAINNQAIYENRQNNTVRVHWHDCEYSGLSAFEPAFYIEVGRGGGEDSAPQYKVLVSDCYAHDWRDYGFFSPGVDTKPLADMNIDQSVLAFIGCRVTQNVDALNGGIKGGLHNTHGPIRTGDVGTVIVSQCDLFSRNGWSDYGSGTFDQPCIRLNFKAKEGSSANIERVVAEGGGHVISWSGEDSGSVDYPGNYLVDKAFLLGTAQTDEWIKFHFGGTTIRNVLTLMPNIPSQHGKINGGMFAKLDVDNTSDPENLGVPVLIYGNSHTNLRNSTNDPGEGWELTEGGQPFTSLTAANNLVYGPNLDTPVSPSVTTDGTVPGVTPRFKGYRLNFEYDEIAFTAGTMNDTDDILIPYSSITDDLVRETGGSATSQSYWTTNGGTNHHIIVAVNPGSGNQTWTLRAADGDFTVAFEAGGIRVTNTSGENWVPLEGAFRLKLDRDSIIPAMDTSGASTGATLTKVISATDASGLSPYDDFELTVRSSGKSGAISA